jgi:glutamate/tyrosine decarboxylase-like PLP-dependent enzyme
MGKSAPKRGSRRYASYFLGPKGQNANLWHELLNRVFYDYVHWRRNYFPDDPSIITPSDRRDPDQIEWLDGLSSHLDVMMDKLKVDYPFYSPRYVAHMTSDQTLPGVLGLFAGILYNPNNVTREVAPVTVDLEIEVGELLVNMLGLNRASGRAPWGHLASGGTVATIEALWVARQAQFTPLIVADLCERGDARETVLETLEARGQSPPAKVKNILESDVWGEFLAKELSDWSSPATGLHLHPTTQLIMLRTLRNFLFDRLDGEPEKKTRLSPHFTAFLTEAVDRSPYNPAARGYSPVLAKVNEESGTRLARGVVFASETGHYCLKKACNLLGYGSDGLRLIPVDKKFRMDIDALEYELNELDREEYLAAVVGIAGTTEEGAVDPIHKILKRREKTPFWLHVDAAWGGYVAAVFDRRPDGKLAIEHGAPTVTGGTEIEEEVRRAFGAIGNCDSAVVDPHKLGYIPYPSGAVLFGHSDTRLLTAQTAPYIGAGGEGPDPLAPGSVAPPRSIGDYILEGSKPGAGAAAVWLAHKAIPLSPEGHGEIVGQTLLAAQKLARALELRGMADSDGRRSSFIRFHLLTQPDTNVVTFVARPMRRRPNKPEQVEPLPWSLRELNRLNEGIHTRMGTPRRRDQAKTSLEGEAVPPYGHDFFVSKTMMVSDRQRDGTYSFRSVKPLLKELLPKKTKFKKVYNGSPEGLFALRCVVMNPLYQLAEDLEKDYISEFAAKLHQVATTLLERFTEQLHAYTLLECKPGKGKTIAKRLRAEGGTIRRAVAVHDIKDSNHSKDPKDDWVILEVRQGLGRRQQTNEDIRQLISEYDTKGIKRAETFIGTNCRENHPPGTDPKPIVYLFLKALPGQAEALVTEAMKAKPLKSVGIEARIVTGQYDVVVALSGLKPDETGTAITTLRTLANCAADDESGSVGQRAWRAFQRNLGSE